MRASKAVSLLAATASLPASAQTQALPEVRRDAGRAAAPRLDSDPIATAEDAFGSSAGRESIGIYSPRDVRGFSPFVAGNVRFDGMYVDAVAYPIILLVSGATVRVGTSAQTFPFPSPSGIADFRLREPGREAEVRAIAAADAFGTRNIEIDASLPVNDQVRIFASGFAGHDELASGSSGNYYAGSAVARWNPAPNLDFKAFWSKILRRQEETAPLVVLGTGDEPPRLQRRRFYGQDWTRGNGENGNYGAIARFRPGRLTLSAAGFRSYIALSRSYADLYLGVDPVGRAAEHRIVANPPQLSASTSGELRADLPFTTGAATHAITAAVWGRDQRRRYGGGTARDFGTSTIGSFKPVPAFRSTGAEVSNDAIEQLSVGGAYRLAVREAGGLTLGLRRTSYRKTTLAPGRSPIASRDAPVLLNGAGNLSVLRGMTLFGSYSEGLEESAVAPASALNRDEAPPAVRTSQVDFGFRTTLRNLRAVAGVFQIKKPYFNLDAASIYRQLGDVRHRGVEFSLTGEPVRDLTLLLGGVLLEAKVEGPAVASGLVGSRPVGVPSRSVTLSSEYRLPWTRGLSVDVNAIHSGQRAANTANMRFADSFTTIDVGARYRWTTRSATMSLRVQASNVLNVYRWLPQASDTYAYNSPRSGNIRLTVER